MKKARKEGLTFGKFLKSMRIKENLSQINLAAKLHVCPGTLSRMENSVELPHPRNAVYKNPPPKTYPLVG